MTGLRARQKASRNRRILQAAADLFRSTGYAAARIEDIAAAAEVSVGTLYNYFETKGDLLLAIVSMEVEEVHDFGRTVLADPQHPYSRQLRDAVLLPQYLNASRVFFDAMAGVAGAVALPRTTVAAPTTDLMRPISADATLGVDRQAAISNPVTTRTRIRTPPR